MLVLLGVGVLVFAATNVDDLFVLLAFFSDPRFATRQVVIGQYAGITALIALSVALSLLGYAIPAAYVGLLGLIPLAIGVKKLLGRDERSDGAILPRDRTSVLTVAVVTVANGADNVAVYAPLFATRRAWELATLAASFLALTAIWCAVGHYLVHHPTVGKPLRRYGRACLPWVLIGLGVYLLLSVGF